METHVQRQDVPPCIADHCHMPAAVQRWPSSGLAGRAIGVVCRSRWQMSFILRASSLLTIHVLLSGHVSRPSPFSMLSLSLSFPHRYMYPI